MKITTYHYTITTLLWASAIILTHQYPIPGIILSILPIILTTNLIIIHYHNYKKNTKRIEKALDLIDKYAGIDGDHHKTWLLNELVTTLADNPTEWIEQYENGEDGPRTYQWDEGIAP